MPYFYNSHLLILHRHCYSQNRLRYPLSMLRFIWLFITHRLCRVAGHNRGRLSSKETVEAPLSIREYQVLLQDTELLLESFVTFYSFRRSFSLLRLRATRYCLISFYSYCSRLQKSFHTIIG